MKSVVPILAGIALATPAAAQSGLSPVMYVRGQGGGFERSIPIVTPMPRRVGEEIRAGASTYRVLRVLHLLVDGRITETRIYVERIGPAEPD